MPSRRFAPFVAAAALILICPWFVSAQGLRFDSEKIIVFVEADQIRVEGTYVIANGTDVDRPQRLYYPFPVDSLHTAVHDITVTVGDSALSFKETTQGILFSIPLPAKGTATFNVTYTQPCLDRTGCYILMTTSLWNAPLREVLFEIHVPPGIELVASSYEFDSVVEEDGARTHRMVRHDFMPEADLCVGWRVFQN